MMLGPIDQQRLNDIRRKLEIVYAAPIAEQEIRRFLPGVLYRRNGLIHLTKLNDTPFVLNAELIETIEATPDSIITLVNGRKYLARESVEEIRRRCLEYKREIHSYAKNP
ncbi:MAG: flagellar FlbD family protein [Candidatus Omnitrophota bacterium]